MKGKEFVKLLEQNGKTVSVHSNDIGSGLLNKLMRQTGLK